MLKKLTIGVTPYFHEIGDKKVYDSFYNARILMGLVALAFCSTFCW